MQSVRITATCPGRRVTPLSAAALVLLCACEPSTPQAEPPDAPAAEERPEERVDTLMLEGMAEPMRVRLFETPAGFPLRFSTYVPEDMRPEVLEADSGASVRFTTAFGGTPNPNAYLNIHVYPESMDAAGAAAAADAFAVSRGVPVSQGEGDDEPDWPRRYAWSLAEYPFDHPGPEGGRMVGLVAVGTHGERVFHVIQQHPEEYGDGFGPRAALILEELRWADTGRGLQPAPDTLR